MIVARRFVIRGRVQAVGFRFFAEEAAAREGISGYVRNLPDGSVETLAEGDAEAVGRFEQAIRRGPFGARVDSVETTIEPPRGGRGGFIIRG